MLSVANPPIYVDTAQDGTAPGDFAYSDGNDRYRL
jgi:hypothetical protein